MKGVDTKTVALPFHHVVIIASAGVVKECNVGQAVHQSTPDDGDFQ